MISPSLLYAETELKRLNDLGFEYLLDVNLYGLYCWLTSVPFLVLLGSLTIFNPYLLCFLAPLGILRAARSRVAWYRTLRHRHLRAARALTRIFNKQLSLTREVYLEDILTSPEYVRTTFGNNLPDYASAAAWVIVSHFLHRHLETVAKSATNYTHVLIDWNLLARKTK